MADGYEETDWPMQYTQSVAIHGFERLIRQSSHLCSRRETWVVSSWVEPGLGIGMALREALCPIKAQAQVQKEPGIGLANGIWHGQGAR